jgi:phosphoglycerate kinase
MDQLEVTGKRVLVRVDFNVPLKGKEVIDDTRIRAALPTLEALLDRGATIVLMSHLGRPKGPEERYRMAPVAERLAALLGREVRYLPAAGPATQEVQDSVHKAPIGSVTLLENTRFHPGETKNDPALAKMLATYAEAFVNDAFGAAHRAHASTTGVAHLLPSAAGLLLAKELTVLGRLLHDPARPFKVILGGAKVSDKIGVIENLLNRVDAIIIGGAMAYTFLKAQGGQVGKSLVEDDKLTVATDLLESARASGVDIYLPEDSVCAAEVSAGVGSTIHPSGAIPASLMGLDAGPAAVSAFQQALVGAKTILWNGPLGVFEVPPFDRATKTLAETVADLPAFSVVGGGDSVAALRATGVEQKIDHISTGGGASLEFLEGKTLPGVAVLTS